MLELARCLGADHVAPTRRKPAYVGQDARLVVGTD